MSLLQALHRMDAGEDLAALSCSCCCRVAPHKACHQKSRLMKSQLPCQQGSWRGDTLRTSTANPAMQAARQASSLACL